MDKDESHNHQSPSSGDLRIGAAFSHYRILEKIGAGGMGEVYLAHDTELDRKVALKILSPDRCRDEECRSRFRHEAQAVAKLNHPNIVQIYEVAEHGGVLFFAMEYVEGPAVTEACQRAVAPVECAIEIGLQICGALEAAHAAGITHRDLKPSNVLIGSDNRVRLVDFGLAATETSEPPDGAGSILGTVGYMSPEQIRGEPVDTRSDLFSLGIVLYELLAARRPFRGEYEAAVQYAIVNDRAPSLNDVNPDVPTVLAELVDDLLAKDPDRRPATAAEVHDRLVAVAGDSERSAPARPGRPRTVLWLLSIAVLFLVGAYLLWSPAPEVEGPVRLAVLPLRNVSASDNNYFATGVTEAITTGLAGLDGIRVISSQSAALFADTNLTTAEIGRELGVQYLLEGTIQAGRRDEAGSISISVRLLGMKDDSYLWSRDYQMTEAQLLAVQSQITEEITRALNVLVSESQADRLARRPTNSPEAYDLYLRGNEYFNKTWSAEDIAIAIRMYGRAIALDSTFALAWAMLSRGHASMYWEYYDRSDERCHLALGAAEQALTLQPDLAEGHEALGYCYYHCYQRFDAALDEFEAGLMFQPSSAGLYNATAAVQRRQGRLVESVANFKHALDLDPQSQQKAFDVGLTYGMMRQYDSTHAYVDRTIELAPEWTLPYLYRAWLPVIEDGDTAAAVRALQDAVYRADIYESPFYWWLARLVESDYGHILAVTRPGTDTAAFYLHRARLYRLMDSSAAARYSADSARLLLAEKLRDHPEDPRYLSQMSLASAFLGDTARAVELGQRAVQYLPASREAFDAPFLLVNLAEVLVMCGMHEAAIGQLQQLLALPGFVSVPYLELDPLWKPLRNHPGFRDLVTATGRSKDPG